MQCGIRVGQKNLLIILDSNSYNIVRVSVGILCAEYDCNLLSETASGLSIKFQLC